MKKSTAWKDANTHAHTPYAFKNAYGVCAA